MKGAMLFTIYYFTYCNNNTTQQNFTKIFKIQFSSSSWWMFFLQFYPQFESGNIGFDSQTFPLDKMGLFFKTMK